jgi:spoIIIJ-associated protein
MSDRSYEFSAKTVEDAVEQGLRTLGLQRESVTIDVINSGSRGILGFGSEPAVIRLTPIETASESADAIGDTPGIEQPVEEEPAAEMHTATVPVVDGIEDDTAQADTGGDVAGEGGDDDDIVAGDIGDEELEALTVDLLSELIELMGFEVEVVAEWRTSTDDEDEPYLNLDIRGDELGVLIGRRGETLANLQFLLRLMINQRLKTWKNIVVDVEQYKQRRMEQLTQLANRMAEQVASSGRAVSLEPMPANERRIIHIALRENPAVYTESTGEGDRRKVAIVPNQS